VTPCVELPDKNQFGLDGPFTDQLNLCGLLSMWVKYKTKILKNGPTDDPLALNGQGRMFCHLNDIPVVIGTEVLLSRIPKRSGYVARFTGLESLLFHLSLKDEWDEFFLGSAFVLLDNEGARSQENWGIYWHDVKRFFGLQGQRLLPMLSSDLPVDALLSIVKGNMKLSDFDLTDEQVDLISLAANGILSDREVLARLSKQR